MDEDIRWKQRFSNYTKAFEQLTEFIKKGSDIDLTLIGENLDLTLTNKIETEIDDLLLPYTFDISIFPQLDNSKLIDHINSVGKTFYLKSTKT